MLICVGDIIPSIYFGDNHNPISWEFRSQPSNLKNDMGFWTPPKWEQKLIEGIFSGIPEYYHFLVYLIKCGQDIVDHTSKFSFVKLAVSTRWAGFQWFPVVTVKNAPQFFWRNTWDYKITINTWDNWGITSTIMEI